MTTVVHVVAAGEVGGAERMLADLSSGDGAGVRHVVAVLSPGDQPARFFRSASLRVHERRHADGPLPFLRQAVGPSEVAWLVGVLRAEGAALAHLHTFASQVVGTRAAREVSIPILRTEHSTRAFVDSTCWPFARWSLARASMSVAVSRHVRDVAAARAPWASPRLRIVRNGVDASRFAPRPFPPADALRLALVGRLEPRKGVDLALRAVSRVPGARLDVIGDGPLRPALERLAHRLQVSDRTAFRGFLDDVAPPIAGCHAVLCTSRSEGLGIALLEGMALERPVLGFAVGGVPEVAGAEGAHLLAPEGDLDALVASLLRAASDPAALGRPGVLARERVARCFSLGAMRAGYADAYARLLGSATIPAA